jgi:nitronate monooxygenase
VDKALDKALEEILNLLLESERAGVTALEHLAPQVEQEELRQFLLGERDEEQRNVEGLEQLLREGGGTPSKAVGPFAAKVAALSTLRERLNLMSHGQEWVARKVEEALAITPADGPIHEFLRDMGNRHRAEIEWGRAEVIRLLNTDK